MTRFNQVANFLLGAILAAGGFVLWQEKDFQQWMASGIGELQREERVLQSEARPLNLPSPVQRYLRKVNGQPHQINLARMQLKGMAFPEHGGKGQAFWARLYVSVSRPEFQLVAKTPLLPGLDIWNCDRLIAGEGAARQELFGAFTMRHQSGEQATKSQLVQYLASLPWVPMAIVQQSNWQWRQIGRQRVEVKARVGRHAARVQVSFDKSGYIKRIEALRLPRLVGRKYQLSHWESRFSRYKLIQGVMVPEQVDMSWATTLGRHVYWSAQLERLDYLE